MSFARKVIVPLDFSDDLSDLIRPLRSMDFLNHSEVIFVHVLDTIVYPVIFGDFPLVYPAGADLQALKESARSLLVNMTTGTLPSEYSGRVSHRVISSSDPKRGFSEFVTEERANLVIIPSRRKHGIFDSSFAQFVNKHTNCDVLIIKHD